jgi:erythromycin esterase-like protein
MAQAILGPRIATCLLSLTAAAAAISAPLELDPNPGALVQAMQGHRIVLLGEVHDNAVQHALRAAALRQTRRFSTPCKSDWIESPIR